MPNYCENDLYIDGTKDEVAKLLAHVATKERLFDFNNIIPYPEKFYKIDEDLEKAGHKRLENLGIFLDGVKNGYNSGGYEWCVENWNTKWNASNCVRRDTSRRICISFSTAWSPPIPVIAKLHQLFPQCSLFLEYFEKGTAVCGGISFLSKDDWYFDEEWSPGKSVNKWEATYKGCRGG